MNERNVESEESQSFKDHSNHSAFDEKDLGI